MQHHHGETTAQILSRMDANRLAIRSIQHSRVRCRKCELALQRRWNRTAARNYRIRTGQVVHRSTAKCAQFGTEFTPKGSSARFCSTTCLVKGS